MPKPSKDPLMAELRWYSPNLALQVRERLFFMALWGGIMGFGVGVFFALVLGLLR